MKGRLASLIGLSLFVATTGYTSDASAYGYRTCGVFSQSNVRWKDIPPRIRASGVSFSTSGSFRGALTNSVSHWNTNPSKFYFNLTYDEPSVDRNNGESEIWFSSDQNVLQGAPAIAYTWRSFWDCSKITEADIIFDVNEGYTTSTNRRSLRGYGGSNRPFQTTASHELGHALGLLHEKRFYNIMGQDWTHIHTNNGTATSYQGEDASNGAVFLYGLHSTPLEDLSVAHWKWSGSSGEYSTHTRTQMYNTSGGVLSYFTNDGETTYNVNKGQQVQLELTYENNGANTKTVQVGYYISTNDFITTADIYIGEGTYTLGRNTPFTDRTTLTIPNTLTSGKYYIGAIVDKNNVVSEQYEYNNATYIPIKVN